MSAPDPSAVPASPAPPDAALDGPPLIRALRQQADEAEQAGHGDEAEALIHRAIALAEAPGTPAELLIDCLFSRAFHLRRADRFADARPVYERALRLVEATPHFDTRLHAILLAQHADGLWMLGQAGPAEAGFRAALAIEERDHPNDCRLLLDGLGNLAHFLQKEQRPAEAVPYLQKAIQILHDLGERAIPEKADTFNRLALAQRAAGNTAGADACLRQALAIAEQHGDEQRTCRFRHAHYDAVVRPKIRDLPAPETAVDPAFTQHFLRATWFVPLLLSSRTDSPIFVSTEDDFSVPYLLQHHGHPHLPIFDSRDRLSAWIEVQSGLYLGMAGHTLLKTFTREAHYLLHPDSTTPGVLSPAAVEDLRRAIPPL